MCENKQFTGIRRLLIVLVIPSSHCYHDIPMMLYVPNDVWTQPPPPTVGGLVKSTVFPTVSDGALPRSLYLKVVRFDFKERWGLGVNEAAQSLELKRLRTKCNWFNFYLVGVRLYTPAED